MQYQIREHGAEGLTTIEVDNLDLKVIVAALRRAARSARQRRLAAHAALLADDFDPAVRDAFDLTGWASHAAWGR